MRTRLNPIVPSPAIFLLLLLPLTLLVATLWPESAIAHERWILSPSEVQAWNAQPKPTTYTQVSLVNVIILGLAFLFTLGWVRLGFTGAREMFQDLVARLNSYADYASVILRFCMAWALISSAFALEPRVGNEMFASPTLLAPDLELSLLGPEWYWVGKLEIVLAIMFLFGIYVRLAAVLLIVAVFLAYYLFGNALNSDLISALIHNPVHAYSLSVWGVALYLLLQGPGSYFLPLPVPAPLRGLVDWLASQPRQRAQFLLRWAAGLNFLILGIWFKVLQPNLALGILVTYEVPILSAAPEAFVLVMAVVEVLAGVFLMLGILMRAISIFLLVAMIFFAAALPESFTAHIIAYGIMLTFIFNGAGHWRRPQATDKPAHIVILGGGFAGLRAAMRLEKLRGAYTNIRVTLVHPRTDFLFAPLLPEVVGGSIQPGNVVNPIRRILDSTRVIQGQIDALDADEGRIELTRRSGQNMRLEYDQLILAPEPIPDFDGLPGLLDHSEAIDTVGDALYLRKAVVHHLAEAEHLPMGEERSRLLTFAVIGGGQRGSATALEIRTLVRVALNDYPGISTDELRIVLFEDPKAPEQSIPELLKPLRNQVLRDCGVTLMSEPKPECITPDGITRTNGERLACTTMVNARYRNLHLYLPVADKEGFVTTDDNLATTGVDRIWVASSIDARHRGRFVTLKEQRLQGEAAAYNAYAATQGFEPRGYRPGRRLVQVLHMGWASASSVLGLRFSGFPAWLTSRLECVNALPGLERDLRIFMDWILDIPFRNDIAVLAPQRTERLSRAHYHAGDTVITEGETGDNAFLIRQGRVRIIKGGQTLGQLGTGDCFGEIALLTDAPRTATVVCETPCEFTVLAREQFTDLTTGFRELGDALKRQTEQRNKTLATDPA